MRLSVLLLKGSNHVEFLHGLEPFFENPLTSALPIFEVLLIVFSTFER